MKKYLFTLLLVYNSLWAQPPHTFTANGSLVVPAGITSMTVEAWGGGGAGGGAGGSGLTEGRGAAGGGGGAYAKANITVVAGVTLNVVVAPQTTGSTTNGGTGAASTITGFESSIFAAGGSGGFANTAGGTPAAGAGGTVAGSIGGLARNPGTTGTAGSTTFLSVLFSSGKGGAAATPGGGAGGAAFGPVILGSGPGNGGAAPGGGGGGAMSSALSASQIGGSGAAGQVIVTYTCPAYAISTGTSAANVCVTSGTSLVTITSSAASLPIGTYTVTYSLSSPAGSGFTAPMTVTTAGTGTFTASGLSTLGTSTITVNRLTSGVCFSNISANNTAAVTISAGSVGGSIAGGSTICSGFTSGNLTLSGQTGNVIKWQSSTDGFSTATDIANTGLTYTSGPLTATTQFIAVVQNGTCSAANSTAVTVTVNPLPAAPIIGTIVLPTCAVPTGSIPLSGLPAGGTLRMYPGAVVQPYSGTAVTISGLAANTYTFTVSNATCTSLVSANAVVPGLVTNTYSGSWSNGTPNLNQNLVFAGNFVSAGGGSGNINGCSCTINSGVNISILGGDTLTLTNALSNNGGTLTFENNASLLQTANAVNTGNIIYKRNTTAVRRLDYTYWSSPVTRTPIFTLNNLSPNTSSTFYFKYNPTTGWVTINSGSEAMMPGVGYIIAAPQTFDINTPAVFSGLFEGVPNNGTVAIPLTAIDKWNLVGNPYPSAVYADQFIFDNTANLYGTLYFWTHNSSPVNTDPDQVNRYFYSSNDYAAYNLTGSVGSGIGTGATTPGNNLPPSRYIASGQSFFVKSKTTTSASFTNSMRVPANNTQFFKTIEEKQNQIEKHRIWLNFTNSEGAFKQTLIGYITGATNTWDDNYDGASFNGNEYVDFYSINETKKLTIQGRALPFNDADQIPLGYKSTIAGEFSISIDHVDGLFNDQPVYLEDKSTGLVHNLKESNYTFTTEIGSFIDRFVLRFTNKTLGVSDFVDPQNDVLVAVKDKVIKLSSVKENIKEIYIYDVSGKLLYNKKKVGETEWQISNLVKGNQVLFVKTTLDSDQIFTKKIVF